MAEKMGNTYNSSVMKTPLTVGKPKGEKGPDVNNNPVMKPEDPLGFIPSGGDRGKGF